jgi:hypothetical protein
MKSDDHLYEGRVGDWMRTRSGGRFYPQDVRPGDIKPLDIASGLARECRYGGQISGWFTVAEHSILVAGLLPPHLRFAGLMHDAPEGLIRDMTRPNKRALPDYQKLEDEVWAAIAATYGLDLELDPLIKQADNDVLLAERSVFYPNDYTKWDIRGTAADVEIRQLNPWEAESAFLNLFHELTEGAFK